MVEKNSDHWEDVKCTKGPSLSPEAVTVLSFMKLYTYICMWYVSIHTCAHAYISNLCQTNGSMLYILFDTFIFLTNVV